MPSIVKEETTEPGSSQTPSKVWILVGLIAAVIGVAVMFIAGAQGGVSEDAAAREDSVPLVETAPVRAAGNAYEVRAPGRLQARETLELVGEVSGKVTAINPNLKLGGRIEGGATILRIDDGDFQADVAQANAQLATAKAGLEQARAERDRQVRLAELGASPEKAAEQAIAAFEDANANVERAEAQLVIARRQLDKAVIRAPFDAIVTSESVARGTFVSPGQPLATLISAEGGEIRASLPAEDVSAVRAAIRATEDGQLPVRAIPNTTSLTSKVLEGYLAEFSPVIDREARTATVIAVFPDAFTPENEGEVFSDDFMDLLIQGMSEAPIWEVPAGAVRQDSFVWVVGPDEQIERVAVDVIDRENDHALLHAEMFSGDERVMTTVLAEEIEGMRVHVVESAL